jgi:hypothetical protein
MTPPRARLLAAVATLLGLVAGGFDAHLAPQGDSWWHGLTGTPGAGLVAWAMAAAAAVFALGRVPDVRPFIGMVAGLLPLVPAVTGVGAPLLGFSIWATSLLFAILLGWTARDLFTSLPRLEPVTAVLIAFASFLFVGRFLPGPAGPQGDEPHYLLIAESLIVDGDVDLKNQFDERAYTKFTSGNLEPHTAPRSPSDRLYAIHTPGLSALVAPGYASLGYQGARAVISLLMAGVVGLLLQATRSLFGEATAKFVFLLSTFASPLPIYANAVFPDSVAALPVAATIAWMVAGRPLLLALAASSIAGLPWVHPRFLPLALLLSLAIVFRGGFSLARAAAVLLPLVASVGLLLFHFQSLFGSASLSAAYGPAFATDVSLSRVPWGALALLLDRQFGLLLFAPVLWLGLPGLVVVWKQDRLLALVLAGVAGILLGTGSAFSMWWGGASAPIRFLIGATPVLLLSCGAAFRDSEMRRAPLGAGSGFGLGLLGIACLAPRALHNRSDGESGLLRLLSPTLDLDRFFPGFVSGSSLTLLALLWAMVLLVSLLRPRLAVWAAVVPVLVGWLGAAKPLLDPFASSLRALESWPDHRRTFGGRDTEAGFSLEVPLGPLAGEMEPGESLYSPRFSLPEGAWTLRAQTRVEGSGDALNVCRLSLVTADEGGPPLATLMVKVNESAGETDFALARHEMRVHLKGEGLQLRTRIVKITLIRRPG